MMGTNTKGPSAAAAGAEGEAALASPCEVRDLPLGRLADMAAAGGQIRECYRLLRKGGGNIVGEVLRGHGAFCDWEHYPPGDVYDDETHAQYYYHAHPGAWRFAEHGHFHTFLRPPGMPPGVRPAGSADDDAQARGGTGCDGAPSHLVAISMDDAGYPLRLFTTNRWVTGEAWYAADDVIRMLDRFVVDLAYPSLPVNIWITAMLRLFRPEIEVLIRERDAALEASAAAGAGRSAHEDRDVEILSSLEVSVEERLEGVIRALELRQGR